MSPILSRDGGSGPSILVCDDDRLVLATLVHGLQSAGFRVIEADNGDDAILLAREHRPDLALLDVRMSGKTGLDVAAYLRDHVGTPFMFLSAFSDERIVRQAAEFGALAYLVKPLDVRRIVPAVHGALARVSPGEAVGPAPVAELAVAARPAGGPPAAPAGPAADSCGVLMPGDDPALDPVPIAIGVLMERHRLPLVAARERLEAIAAAHRVPVADAAASVVDAADLLSGPASRPA